MQPRGNKHIGTWLGLMASLFLAACGFEPLYSQNESGIGSHDYLRQIEVAPMEARLGQVVYTSLVNELTPLGTPAVPNYRLTLELKEKREGLGFEDDDTVTRFNYELLAKYQLRDFTSDKILFQSASRSIAAYNVVDNQFATLTARHDAEARAAKDLSRSVKLQLALYFRQAQTSDS
jgi:LPS-assembly lipoprotein